LNCVIVVHPSCDLHMLLRKKKRNSLLSLLMMRKDLHKLKRLI